MTKYGKIIIEANSIEEAEKDLAMIKALANAGAVMGQGSGITGRVEIQMSAPSIPSNHRCTDCSMCDCGCYDDFNGTDDYEEEEISEALDRFVMQSSPTAQRMFMELLSNL